MKQMQNEFALVCRTFMVPWHVPVPWHVSVPWQVSVSLHGRVCANDDVCCGEVKCMKFFGIHVLLGKNDVCREARCIYMQPSANGHY